MPPAPESKQGLHHPLFDVVVNSLMPMFLEAFDGDPERARIAALEAILDFQPGNFLDLMLVAQIIALSISSTSSLLDSMRTDFPPATALKFQSLAYSLNRTADRCRKSRDKSRQTSPKPVQAPSSAEKRAWSGTFPQVGQDSSGNAARVQRGRPRRRSNPLA